MVSRMNSLLEKNSKNYLLLSSTIQLSCIKDLLQKLDIQKGSKVVDYGCGTGNLTKNLSEAVGTHGEVVAFDPDSQRIQTAKKYVRAENTVFHCGKINDIRLKSNYFDHVIANYVFHWLKPQERRQGLNQVFAVLKRNGSFCLNISPRLPVYMEKIVQNFTQKDKNVYKSIFYSENKDYWRKLFEESAFVIEHMESKDHECELENLEAFLNWSTASFHGRFDFKGYYKRIENIEFQMTREGRIIEIVPTVEVILKKTDSK